jgi:hypothetical protein
MPVNYRDLFRPPFKAAAILAAVLCLSSWPAEAGKRDQAQRAAFQKANPCPSTGKPRGACPGYVVDHVRPLCAGGRDHFSNMQWQTTAAAKAKDRLEQAECRELRAKKATH